MQTNERTKRSLLDFVAKHFSENLGGASFLFRCYVVKKSFLIVAKLNGPLT